MNRYQSIPIAAFFLLSFFCILAIHPGYAYGQSPTLTVSFQGSGSGVEECSGAWGYQRVTFNMDVDIEVTAINPSEAGGVVTYDLSHKTGTIHFYGMAEDVYYGDTTTLNFDRTQTLDLQNLEGTLQYSIGQCGSLYIGFSVPASSSLPYSIYLQYSASLGIIRNTVNMPYPWNAGVTCLDNNYDIDGTDDFDVCSIDLQIDKNPLPPGETTKIHAFTCPEVDPAQPLVWEIAPVYGNDIKATITPDGILGETATISDVEGIGKLVITVTNPSVPGCSGREMLCVECECVNNPNRCLQPGKGFLETSHAGIRYTLGRTKRGESAGDIFLSAGTPSPGNSTPGILEVYGSGNDLERLCDGNGLRQIVAPDAFVDIIVIDQYSYSMSFYDLSDLSGMVGGYYEVVPGAIPNVTWTIENPDASPSIFDRLRLTEDRNGQIRVNEYEWDAVENAWSLNKGNGLQVVSRKEENIGGNRVVTETIKDEFDVVASVVRTTYADITYSGTISEEIIEIVEDPAGDALTTVRNWHQDPCTQGNCGRLASQFNPDGSWVRYEYDSLGRKTLEIRSWLDAPSTSPAGSARAIYYDYSAQDASDSQAAEDARLPRKITEKILDNEVSTTYYIYTNNGDGSRTVILERTAAPGAVYGAPGNLRTITEYYPYSNSSADSGQMKSVTHPDETKDTYTYEYGTYTPNADPTQPGTFTSGAGTDVQELIVHGTTGSSWGIAYKSTGEKYIRNHLGDLLLQTTDVSTGGGYYSQLDWTVHTYDAFGRILMSNRSNGARTDTTWDCCAKSSETNEQGVVRHYTYDALNRVLTETKEATDDIVTAYTYDGAGRTLLRTTNAGGLNQSSSSVYDIAGRLILNIDTGGLATGYGYASGGLITTVTRPGGATEITERFLDGRTKSITGTAVIPRYYSYGVNGDGTQWTRVDTGSPSSVMWAKTTTDMLGRTIREEKPGFSGTEATVYFYNHLGQLIRTTSPGMADTLYTYDAIGNQVQSGLDVDGSGALDPASMDRITETQTAYVLDISDWWHESVQKVYAIDNDNTETVVHTNRIRFTGLGIAGLSAESVDIDIHGNQTVSTEIIDRAAKTVTRSVDYPDSIIDAVSVTTNGLLTSTASKTEVTTIFGYDALERQTSVTDPRTGSSITSFNAQGRVDYMQDPAGNTTQYTYDAATGRKTVETNALTKSVRFAYNNRGQVTQTWGDAVYPVEYVYDSYGRMSEMHTWRQELGWTGATWPGGGGVEDVTTWIYQESTGLLIGKQDDAGKTVTYTYEAGGRLTTRTWARLDNSSPIVTTYSYDPDNGELLTIDYSDTTPDISFTYDRLGQLATVTDAVGSRTFTYNTALQPETESITGLYNRVITRSYSTAGVTGLPVGFNAGADYAISYDYDTVGRMNTVGWNVEGASHAATYSYLLNSDLLQQMTTDDGLQNTYTYEPNRNLRTRIENRFNSALISQYDYVYDAIGRRTSVVNDGQAFTATNPGFNLYDYNDRNEVVESDRYLGTNTADTTNPVISEYRAFTYDPIGNRLNHTEGPDSGTYTTNNLNQYTQQDLPQGGTRDFTYDDDGNLTSTIEGNNTTQYQYNGENRLIAVQPAAPVEGDKRLEFIYDYMGRRVQKKIYSYQSSVFSLQANHFYVYDGWNLIEEQESSIQNPGSRYYVWGLDLSQSLQGAGGVGGLITSFSKLVSDLNNDGVVDGSDLVLLINDPSQVDIAVFNAQYGQSSPASTSGYYGFYYLYDGNGNVGQLIDAADGDIASHYEYDPYGNNIVADDSMAMGNVYGFSTKYFDEEFGLYYYGYRFYFPNLGRWVNKDPMREQGGHNLYSFVSNHSTSGIDPLGLAEKKVGFFETFCVYYFLGKGAKNFPGYSESVWRGILQSETVEIYDDYIKCIAQKAVKGNRNHVSNVALNRQKLASQYHMPYFLNDFDSFNAAFTVGAGHLSVENSKLFIECIEGLCTMKAILTFKLTDFYSFKKLDWESTSVDSPNYGKVIPDKELPGFGNNWILNWVFKITAPLSEDFAAEDTHTRTTTYTFHSDECSRDDCDEIIKGLPKRGDPPKKAAPPKKNCGRYFYRPYIPIITPCN